MLATRIGLMYGGQGSQTTTLGKDFYDAFPSVKEIYDAYPQIRDMAFYGSETEIAKTQNTQRILILFHIAITNLLKQDFTPHSAMGISLGEYGALYAAQVLPAEEIIAIIEKRADSMASASSTLPLSSVAVLNSDFDWLFAHAGKESYYISNINSPTQVVITGKNMEKWMDALKTEGYKKTIPLSLSGGFHSPFMEQTETLLNDLFAGISFAEPKIPIYFNYGKEEMDIKNRMAKQVSNTIDVHSSLEKAVKNNDILIELGANGILQNMVKKIDRQKKVLPLCTVEDYQKVRQEFGK